MQVLKTAATGMMAQQMSIEVIANNIANANTTAFKRARAEFTDLMYQSERRQGTFSSDAGTIVPVGVEIGLGVKPSAVARIETQGALTSTGNPLDLAMDGPGFFAIELPSGETAYSRAGTFQRSPEGLIVTVDGYQVEPGIVIPDAATDVVINRSGEVFAVVSGETEQRLIGEIQTIRFINEAGLEAMGDNLYRATQGSGEPIPGTPGQDGFGSVRQGYVEAANVNIVEEITDLITVQRAYEMNAKVIETGDQMSATVSNLR